VRPYGVKSVTNPLPAGGSAAPELIDDARQNAPMKVLTLDRIVSIRDYRDFAQAFSGIGKARVDVVWSQGHRLFNLTLGTSSGKPATSDLLLVQALAGAIDQQRAIQLPLSLTPFRPAYFRVALRLVLDSRYIAADVQTAVRAAIASEFSFTRRAFAQLVTAAEIYALVQQVPGVIGVDVQKLYRIEDASGPSQTTPPPVLLAQAATVSGKTVEGAELLLIDPGPQGIQLQEGS